MSKNTIKFEAVYLRIYEIENLLDNRIESGMTKWERLDLIKEYKKLGKRLNVLTPKISESDFESELASMLCMDFDVFNDEWNTEYCML
jgi:hypothetical protein